MIFWFLLQRFEVLVFISNIYFDHDINDNRVLIVLYQVTLAEEVMAKNATISPDREQVTKMITMMITMMMMMMITKMIL